jgi:hypothetical protein
MLSPQGGHPWPPEDEGVAVEPLNEAERMERDAKLGDWRDADREHLYRKAALADWFHEGGAWRDHGSWQAFCRARDGLATHESQVDELRAIHRRRQEVTQICVKLGRPEPWWPTRPYHWAPMVRYSPTVSDPFKLLDILDEAPTMAEPGLP